MVRVYRWRIQSEIWLSRVHPLWLLPAILVAAWLVVHYVVLPHTGERVFESRSVRKELFDQLQQSLERSQIATSPPSGWEALNRVLLPAHNKNNTFQDMFRAAATSHVAVKEANYHSTPVPSLGLEKITIVIPVKANYIAIRSWFDEILASEPALSLDEIVFKRDVVGNGQLEAVLKFSLYCKAESTVQSTAVVVK